LPEIPPFRPDKVFSVQSLGERLRQLPTHVVAISQNSDLLNLNYLISGYAAIITQMENIAKAIQVVDFVSFIPT
jgi:hypothetical protein